MLRVEDLVVEFIHEGYAVRPLDGLSFDAQPGELVVLLGPSGSGKTTLLSCLGGILSPKSGRISLDDVDITGLGRSALDAYRRTRVGFAFQAFNLIPSLTAVENVAVPLMVGGRSKKDAFARARALISTVGLADRADHRPGRLSGGQQQRVALARGLAHEPDLLLADEPTANLDHIQTEQVINLLRELRSKGRIIVVSTHDSRLVPIADRIVEMAPETPEGIGAPTEVRYLAGEEIFTQGDPPDLVYVIEEGEVDIVRVLADGSEELLASPRAGQYFGELGPTLGFPRSASARAKTDVRLTASNVIEFRRRVFGSG
ncbi:MAG: ATP-binding cassette domain-containing protein [Acidimicrobiia bacterium]|nr:ATP-binding cassette domain-containing protein [Acidimicrobiia bacterium]